jgi:hypothetical protein
VRVEAFDPQKAQPPGDREVRPSPRPSPRRGEGELRKKQQAHEVTRDVTAWACCCLGPILLATCSLPGPASILSAEALFLRAASPTDGWSRQFPPRPLTQWGGLAVSRLDGRGFSLSRVLFLGSDVLSPRYQSVWVVLDPTIQRDGGLSPRGARSSHAATITSGCLLDVFASISSGWPKSAVAINQTCVGSFKTADSRLATPSLAADSRRARILLASHGSSPFRASFGESNFLSKSLFQFRRSLSCPTTRGNISR